MLQPLELPPQTGGVVAKSGNAIKFGYGASCTITLNSTSPPIEGNLTINRRNLFFKNYRAIGDDRPETATLDGQPSIWKTIE